MTSQGLLGEYVVVSVKVEGAVNPFIYNGKLMDISNEQVVLDDVKLGRIIFSLRSVEKIRKMNRIDMIELARKYERWAMRLKFEQADDKIKQRFREVIEKFRKDKE